MSLGCNFRLTARTLSPRRLQVPRCTAYFGTTNIPARLDAAVMRVRNRIPYTMIRPDAQV